MYQLGSLYNTQMYHNILPTGLSFVTAIRTNFWYNNGSWYIRITMLSLVSFKSEANCL